MGYWIYFIHPPRDDFAATMTDEESEAWRQHWERMQQLFDEGKVVLAGPTLGRVNTGLCILDVSDEETARKLMDEDPAIAGGFGRGDLRPFRLSLLRGEGVRPPSHTDGGS